MAHELADRIQDTRLRMERDPGSGAYLLLADLLREAGEFEEALSVLSEGAMHHPGSHSARVVLGRTLLEAGRADDARPVLRQVLDADPDNLVVLRLLAEDARSRGAWSEAVPYLMRLEELEPEEERWPAALEEVRSYRDAPQDVEEPAQPGFATLTLVDIYLAQGYHARAVAALRQMLEADPHREDARIRLEALEEIGATGQDAPPAAPAPPVGSPEVAADRARRRRDQKEQFARWLESIGREGGDAK